MGFIIKSQQRPTLPHSYPCSTIGAEGLNFRVRNGNGCFPFAMVTKKTVSVSESVSVSRKYFFSFVTDTYTNTKLYEYG